MQRRSFLGAVTLLAAPLALAADDNAMWKRLQGGKHVILLRHASTVPGIGDPVGFQLAQCRTQRNLSDAGRAEAAAIGAAFRRHQVPLAQVLSSRWCRCLDTAQAAFGRVQPAPMIDSMFTDDLVTQRRKLAEVQAFLKAHSGGGNLVLVTHDVNIRALVGAYAEQGGMIVATIKADGSLEVVGRLAVQV